MFINNNFKAHLGLSSDDPLKINSILTVGSNVFFQTHLWPLIKLQGDATEIFLSFKDKNRESLPVLLNAIRINVDGEFISYFSGIQIIKRNKFEKEILEAREAAEQALLENVETIRLRNDLEKSENLNEQLLQRISRLSAHQDQIDKVLSHDLQEPLRKISFFASMMERETPIVETNLTKILKSVDRLRNLLNRMQRLQALEYRNLTPVSIDLNKIISYSRKNLHERGISYQLKMSELIPFQGDEQQWIRLFEELIENSYKFKNPDVELTIDIKMDYAMQNIFYKTENRYRYEKHLRITYTDNGSGFEQEFAEDVFNLFKKLHNNNGLGIGLTYVKRIIEIHHGMINVKSQTDGGVTFTILLPESVSN